MGLTVTAVHTTPVYCRIVSSTRNFQQYFRDLKQAGSSLSPIERFVFSLVLAHSKTPQAGRANAPHGSSAPANRT
jgi:hypothetical protein